MKTKKNKKGFTLAELLIVVAIIAVLVAIAIPVFTSQLEKSREATDIANVRSAYAEVVTNYLTNNDSNTSIAVQAQQTVPGWTDDNSGTIEYFSNNATYSYSYAAKTDSFTVGINIDSNTGDATPNIN
jgi:prepilin-type N-terminal cleavage/methylation domain-containing protein